MNRRALITVLFGMLVAVLFASVATGGAVRFADRPPSLGQASESDSTPITIAPAIIEAPRVQGDPWQAPAIIETIAKALFCICIAIALVVIAVFLWRHRPTLRWHRRRARTTDFEALDDVAAAVAADAAAQRSALQRGAPRNAIVECWLRLEAAVATTGIERNPADTPAEFTRRILAGVQIDPTAVSDLASLYREARFSDHVMSEEARSAAIVALDAVHAGLGVKGRIVTST
jgi:hypothetical protein